MLPKDSKHRRTSEVALLKEEKIRAFGSYIYIYRKRSRAGAPAGACAKAVTACKVFYLAIARASLYSHSD
jgi:hypothetical protein